jgi:isocitrate dehydrogenase
MAKTKVLPLIELDREEMTRIIRGFIDGKLVLPCIETVESGFVTKDVAALIGKQQKCLIMQDFLDKTDSNLKVAMEMPLAA